ncbi:hypothetical protein HPB50_026565 [Hyalomma asiaticum]|uniref:Uncharacterized protein n=1 Tax=Hyalomma asiaticum TaxID=266040 RepID=A0ACB7TRX5_HYAAI|nr:hypothetical protein HPB50_026565 [Hyalomma asiaticum]
MELSTRVEKAHYYARCQRVQPVFVGRRVHLAIPHPERPTPRGLGRFVDAEVRGVIRALLSAAAAPAASRLQFVK